MLIKLVHKPHFVILGAGITGLSLGWFLKRRYGENISLTILEKSSRAGGWIQTTENEGFLFEKGPRSCRTKGSGIATLQLIEELGLVPEVIVPSSAAQKRFLYVDGHLQPVPSNVLSFCFSPLMKGVLPALWKEWRVPPKNKNEDESIYDFISRRLSPEIAERFIDPLTLGIFAGDIRQLSIRSCFPQLYQWEQEYGSMIKGMLLRKSKKNEFLTPFVRSMQKFSIFTLKSGIETLVKTLTDKLKDALQLETAVMNLEIFPKHVSVMLSGGSSIQADHVFCALPAESVAGILKPLFANFDLNPEIPTASVAIVNMGWRQRVLKHEGFGHLVPTNEKEDVLGVVWDSSAFPQQNRNAQETRLTAMLGGIQYPEIARLSEQEIAEKALKAVAIHLNIDRRPDVIQASIANKAIPQYLVGHDEKVKRVELNLAKLSSRLTLLGSSWHGIAVNDCVDMAKKAVQKLSDLTDYL